MGSDFAYPQDRTFLEKAGSWGYPKPEPPGSDQKRRFRRTARATGSEPQPPATRASGSLGTGQAKGRQASDNLVTSKGLARFFFPEDGLGTAEGKPRDRLGTG